MTIEKLTAFTLAALVSTLALVACGGPAGSGAPVPCTEDADCGGALVCGSLESAEGNTNDICLEEADCGALTCDSGRCGRAPDLDPPADPECIAQ